MKQTQRGKALAPVVDIQPQLCLSIHDYAKVREEMRLLKELGFERVYFVLCNPGYPTFSSPWLSMMPPDKGTENYLLESIRALGDPNWAYMYECQRQGMQAWAIIKPYECGLGQTIPHGKKAQFSISHFETVGGEQINFDTLLSYRPELRVARKPESHLAGKENESITELEIAFCLDSYQQKNWGETYFKFEGIANGDVRIPEVKLWISADNGRYIPYKGSYNCLHSFEYREIKDANGYLVYDEPKRCLIIRLTGLSLPKEHRYMAVTLDECENLHTIPFSMIKAISATGEIPVTVGIHVRTPGSHEEAEKSAEGREWGMEQCPHNCRHPEEAFMDWGFEFDWDGSGYWGVGWCSRRVFGIGRGKAKYMKGTPCEGYSGVREYWLEQVRRVTAMGYDGIDIRFQNHSGMVSDYVNYGYNEPIVQKYKEKHGVDILKEDADPLEIMKIRGEYFLMFMEEASDIIHSVGKKLQIHLRHAFEEPKLSADFNELGFWGMPKVLIDWKKAIDLADEVTLKHYYFNQYREWMGKKIKTYAKSEGKRLWIHCYIRQGEELNDNFFDAVEADENVSGILLYEVCHSLKNENNHGLIEQFGPVGYYEPNVELYVSG